MARLPKVGGDTGDWGTILNDFLEVSHKADGTLRPTTVTAGSYVAANITVNADGRVMQASSSTARISIQNADYDVSANYPEIVLADAASASLTITLPPLAGNKNLYTIKKIDSSINQVTIGTTASQTIDGGLDAVLLVQYASITLVSNGIEWNVI